MSKHQFKKLSITQKQKINGGFSFSVIMGIASLISTISMIIPPIVDAVKSNRQTSSFTFRKRINRPIMPTISNEKKDPQNDYQHFVDIGGSQTLIYS